jgi:hypothetical protein
LSNLLSTIEHDGKLVGKGLGQIMLRIVSEVLFKVSSTSLLCAEAKLLYYKRLGFKELEFHVCTQFVRECCQREEFNIGGTNSVNLYPLELKGSLKFGEIGNIF